MLGLGCCAWAFSSRGAQLLIVAASLLSHTGIVAARHIGSAQNRDQTSVPCFGRWILYYRTARKSLFSLFLIKCKIKDMKKSHSVLALVSQSHLALCDLIFGSPQAPLSTEFSRQEHWSG